MSTCCCTMPGCPICDPKPPPMQGDEIDGPDPVDPVTRISLNLAQLKRLVEEDVQQALAAAEARGYERGRKDAGYDSGLNDGRREGYERCREEAAKVVESMWGHGDGHGKIVKAIRALKA